MMIMVWQCWRKLSLLVLFPSILYGLVVILWLTEMKFGQTLQFSCKSNQLDLLQPNRPWQTVNLAFIEHIYIYTYTSLLWYVHLFREDSSIFLHYFFPINFWYYMNNHLFKKLHSLKISAESFWIILGLILVMFLYLLRAVKPFS